MRSQKIQVLGLTRWSYPFSAKGFRRTASGLEGLRAQLYAPERLDHRMFLLEHVVIPSLRNQTDKDFTHLFLMGDQLPDPWRSRVLELLETVPQIVPVFRPEGRKHQDICREVMLEHVDSTCDVTAQHRLDDDDGVGANFVQKTRSLFPELKPFLNQDGRIALDFTRGFILKSTKKNIAMVPVSMRSWAPAMVVYQRSDSQQSALDFHHLKIWHAMPTMAWQEEPMFIRGAHHDNDSNLATFGRRARGFEFNHRNPKRYFRKRFGIDLAAVEKIWERRKGHFLALEDNTLSFRSAAKAA